jgi:flagellar biosynthesis protein FlhF
MTMKIRTYIAKDMRQALRQVRDEQGPDAVILSTRSIPGGVEVSAAVDFDFNELPVLQPAPVATVAAVPVAPPVVQAVSAEVWAAPVMASAESDPEMRAELRSMRRILETQMAQLAWNDLTRRAPVQAELLKTLAELGIAREVAGELVAALPSDLSYEEAKRRALVMLAQRIDVTGDALLDHGGRLAFVGPTGVGKTTAIAKLAARWVLRHGTRDIALVSIDSQRFGSQEQLKVLGRLLGVESFMLDDVTQLPELLASLPERRLVLIDTAGQSPRDAELPAQAARFCAATALAQVRCCLVLSAASQAGVLAEAHRAFQDFGPTCCLLTKLDESTSLGGTISLLAQTRLPLSYVSDGQRIPEDLSPARAHQLVVRAVKLARETGAVAGEDLLTRTFGRIAHGIA